MVGFRAACSLLVRRSDGLARRGTHGRLGAPFRSRQARSLLDTAAADLGFFPRHFQHLGRDIEGSARAAEPLSVLGPRSTSGLSSCLRDEKSSHLPIGNRQFQTDKLRQRDSLGRRFTLQCSVKTPRNDDG